MPSVRTDSQPISVAQAVAMASAKGTAAHQGQPRLTSVALAPRMLTT